MPILDTVGEGVRRGGGYRAVGAGASWEGGNALFRDMGAGARRRGGTAFVGEGATSQGKGDFNIFKMTSPAAQPFTVVRCRRER